MTTAQTAADQLARLPEPVQAELARLHAWIFAMSQEQRASALGVVTAIAESFVANTGGAEYPTIRMLDAWGQTVRAIDHAEFPREEVV